MWRWRLLLLAAGYAGRPWDFFHMNSVSLDPWGDGDFIISSRNTWAGV